MRTNSVSYQTLTYRGKKVAVDVTGITRRKDFEAAMNRAKREIDMQIYRDNQKLYNKGKKKEE